MNVSRYWFRWLIRNFWEGPRCYLADFGSKDNKPLTITTTYQDAFNSSSSYVKSLADSGNVTFSLGGGGASADVISNLVPLLAFVFAALGGLWLVTRD